LAPWNEITEEDRMGLDDGEEPVYVQRASSSTEAPSRSSNLNIIKNMDIDKNQPQQTYENYDPKYNVYNSEPQPKPGSDPGRNSKGGKGGVVFKAAAPGTILVIGIIAGALIAIILIVVIVLKMRTRSEGHYKVEETRTYQFSAPPATAGVGSLNIQPKVFYFLLSNFQSKLINYMLIHICIVNSYQTHRMVMEMK